MQIGAQVQFEKCWEEVEMTDIFDELAFAQFVGITWPGITLTVPILFARGFLAQARA